MRFCGFSGLKELHPVTKIILIIISFVITYLAVFLLAYPIFHSTTGYDGRGMMAMMMEMNAHNPIHVSHEFVSIIIALIIAGFLSYFLFSPDIEKRERIILKKALSPDEKRLLEEVEKAEDGITQDSLRFRLGWSKAKTSAILSNLDRIGIIQRERMGKTYRVIIERKIR